MSAHSFITRVKIFVASGSDLKDERKETILILNKLNKDRTFANRGNFPNREMEV